MSKTDDPEHRYELARDRLQRADVNVGDSEAILDFLDAIDPALSTVTFTNANGQRETKSYGTLAAYCQSLKRLAELSETPLTEMESDTEVNALFEALETGRHPDVKADGYGRGTLTQWQSAATKFFEHRTELGIDPTAIVVKAQETTGVDDRDMYTREEIESLRDAVNNTRDRCILEMLLNTGQRIRAIQTLRVKDVDTDEGVYYLNTSDGGLKGADRNGTKRPLLGAKRAVYDWLKDHPTKEPDDYLVTCLPSANRGTPGSKLSQSNIRRRLKLIAERAEVSKPPNPHNFRHFFVTTCKRDYGMDDATIKHLIGHGPGSNIMQTTYQHLNDDDHIEAAEVAAGMREARQESPLTPAVCPTCSESLSPSAKACSACGTVFAPDAAATMEQIEDSIWEAKARTEPGSAEDTGVDVLRQAIRADPDLKRELIEDPEIRTALVDDVADEVQDRLAGGE